ncbi:putative G-protein coupled receptor Mth-like 1 [Eufriesea mexicana]|nr:putative G-protein coupled receptor Mth-like 1 [Eufriesea mexicana]
MTEPRRFDRIAQDTVVACRNSIISKDLRPASLEKGQETLRLRVYACYAWGGPLLVAGLAALLDHLPPQPQYTFLRPRFGEKQCWFYDGTSPSASMCPSPSRVRLRQRTAPSRSEDALIRGGHPGTRCMTRLTVTGNECRRRVVRMTYEACTYRVHESTSRRLVGTYERSRLSREQLCSIC